MENENKENKNEEELRKEDKNKEDLKKEEENKKEKNKEKLMITLDFIKKEYDSSINRERVLENKATVLWGAMVFFLSVSKILESYASPRIFLFSRDIFISIFYLLKVIALLAFFISCFFLYKVFELGEVLKLGTENFNLDIAYKVKIEHIIKTYVNFKDKRDKRCDKKAKYLLKAIRASYIFFIVATIQVVFK